MNTRFPSARMNASFGYSLVLMAAHKVESFLTQEWTTAPAYRAILELQLGNGKTVFLTFVITLFAGLLCIFLVLSGRNGILVFLALWGLTFVLEFHHLVRSLAVAHYYSGLYSALAYILLGFLYWPAWVRQLRQRGP